MPKKAIDWDAIQREYRKGLYSNCELGRVFGVAHSTISRRADKYEWTKDFKDEIRHLTDAELIAHEKNTTPTHEDLKETARVNAEVIREHRGDIRRYRGLVSLLAIQLEEAALNRAEIVAEVEKDTESVGAEGQPKVDGNRRARMMRAVSLPGHAGVMRDLSTALKNLIPLERQALGIEDDPKRGADEIEEIIVTIGEGPSE